MERVEFLNNENQRLVGIYQKNKSKELIIICHGYKSSKDYPALDDIAHQLHGNGYSMLRFDFTGHGESEGAHHININQQVSDIGSAIRHFREKKVILIGGSFSGLVAAIASIKYKEVTKLITVNGFFDLRKTGLVYHLLKLFSPIHRRNLIYYDKKFKPERIKIPALVIHAKQDMRVSPSQSKQFYSTLRTKKKFIELPKADHYLSRQTYRDEVVDHIVKWLAS